MAKKDLSMFGEIPHDQTHGCYLCGRKENVRSIGVSNGGNEFFSCGIDEHVCARCATKLSVYDLVVYLDGVAGPDDIPDYPGDEK